MKRKKIAIAAIFSVVILLICFILGVNALLTNYFFCDTSCCLPGMGCVGFTCMESILLVG